MTIACPDCGLLEDIPALQARSAAVCVLCRADLELTSGRSVMAALACGLATLILLFPANLLPLMSVNAFGLQGQNTIAAAALRSCGRTAGFCWPA